MRPSSSSEGKYYGSLSIFFGPLGLTTPGGVRTGRTTDSRPVQPTALGSHPRGPAGLRTFWDTDCVPRVSAYAPSLVQWNVRKRRDVVVREFRNGMGIFGFEVIDRVSLETLRKIAGILRSIGFRDLGGSPLV